MYYEPDDNDKTTKNYTEKYPCSTKESIELVYIIFTFFWLFLIFMLRLYQHYDLILWLILLIPLVVFAINFLSVGEFCCAMEDQMLTGNFLSFAFIVAIILINWNSPLGQHDKTEFFKIVITAFILLMISLIDLWVDKKKMPIVKHIKTSLQTISLTLLAAALYLYYTYQRDHIDHTTSEKILKSKTNYF